MALVPDVSNTQGCVPSERVLDIQSPIFVVGRLASIFRVAINQCLRRSWAGPRIAGCLCNRRLNEPSAKTGVKEGRLDRIAGIAIVPKIDRSTSGCLTQTAVAVEANLTQTLSSIHTSADTTCMGIGNAEGRSNCRIVPQTISDADSRTEVHIVLLDWSAAVTAVGPGTCKLQRAWSSSGKGIGQSRIEE